VNYLPVLSMTTCCYIYHVYMDVNL